MKLLPTGPAGEILLILALTLIPLVVILILAALGVGL
jgi:hypothetical protein